MSSITIRNVPENVKASLVRRAQLTGESLEAFLRRVLQREAATAVSPVEWSEFVYRFVEDAKSLPPLKPGEKDLSEIIEENRLRGGNVTDE